MQRPLRYRRFIAGPPAPWPPLSAQSILPQMSSRRCPRGPFRNAPARRGAVRLCRRAERPTHLSINVSSSIKRRFAARYHSNLQCSFDRQMPTEEDTIDVLCLQPCNYPDDISFMHRSLHKKSVRYLFLLLQCFLGRVSLHFPNEFTVP